MFRNYIGYSILFVIILTTKQANAQDDTTKNHLMIVPHYLGFGGVRIDYERKIAKNHWIQLCPEFYFRESDGNTYNSDDSPFFTYNSSLRKVSGIGLDAYHKIYLGISYQKPGAFISYGASAGYFEIEYADDDNQNAISFNAFSKIGGDILIGYDIGFRKNLIILGIYTGLGFRYSFTNDSQVKEHFTSNFYDYAYSGNIFLIGFRIGTKF